MNLYSTLTVCLILLTSTSFGAQYTPRTQPRRYSSPTSNRLPNRGSNYSPSRHNNSNNRYRQPGRTSPTRNSSRSRSAPRRTTRKPSNRTKKGQANNNRPQGSRKTSNKKTRKTGAQQGKERANNEEEEEEEVIGDDRPRSSAIKKIAQVVPDAVALSDDNAGVYDKSKVPKVDIDGDGKGDKPWYDRLQDFGGEVKNPPPSEGDLKAEKGKPRQVKKTFRYVIPKSLFLDKKSADGTPQDNKVNQAKLKALLSSLGLSDTSMKAIVNSDQWKGDANKFQTADGMGDPVAAASTSPDAASPGAAPGASPDAAPGASPAAAPGAAPDAASPKAAAPDATTPVEAASVPAASLDDPESTSPTPSSSS